MFGDVELEVDSPAEEDDGGVRLRVPGPQFVAIAMPGIRLG